MAARLRGLGIRAQYVFARIQSTFSGTNKWHQLYAFASREFKKIKHNSTGTQTQTTPTRQDRLSASTLMYPRERAS